MTEHESWTAPPGFRIGDGAGGSKDPLAAVQVTPPILISSAELLNLHNAPKILVRVPVGKNAVYAVSLVGRFLGGSLPYNVDSPPSLQASYAQEGGGWTDAFSLDYGGLTAPEGTVQTQAGTPVGLSGVIDGLPLQLRNSGAPIVEGNGTLAVVVAYLSM